MVGSLQEHGGWATHKWIDYVSDDATCFRENKNEGNRGCKFREINQRSFLRKWHWTRDSRRRESDRGKTGVTGGSACVEKSNTGPLAAGGQGQGQERGADASESLRRDVVAWSREGQVWKAAGHWELSEGGANMTHQQTGNGVWNNTTTQSSVAQVSTECRHHPGTGERWGGGGVMRQAKRQMPSCWWSHHWAPTAHCPPSKISQS